MEIKLSIQIFDGDYCNDSESSCNYKMDDRCVLVDRNGSPFTITPPLYNPKLFVKLMKENGKYKKCDWCMSIYKKAKQ